MNSNLELIFGGARGLALAMKSNGFRGSVTIDPQDTYCPITFTCENAEDVAFLNGKKAFGGSFIQHVNMRAFRSADITGGEVPVHETNTDE